MLGFKLHFQLGRLAIVRFKKEESLLLLSIGLVSKPNVTAICVCVLQKTLS